MAIATTSIESVCLAGWLCTRDYWIKSVSSKREHWNSRKLLPISPSLSCSLVLYTIIIAIVLSVAFTVIHPLTIVTFALSRAPDFSIKRMCIQLFAFGFLCMHRAYTQNETHKKGTISLVSIRIHPTQFDHVRYIELVFFSLWFAFFSSLSFIHLLTYQTLFTVWIFRLHMWTSLSCALDFFSGFSFFACNFCVSPQFSAMNEWMNECVRLCTMCSVLVERDIAELPSVHRLHIFFVYKTVEKLSFCCCCCFFSICRK